MHLDDNSASMDHCSLPGLPQVAGNSWVNHRAAYATFLSLSRRLICSSMLLSHSPDKQKLFLILETLHALLLGSVVHSKSYKYSWLGWHMCFRPLLCRMMRAVAS